MGYTFHLSYSYPGDVYDFCTTSYPTRGRFISSVQHHTLPERFFHTLTRQFCDFCNNFVPVPGYGVCLSYPYLEDFCDFFTTLYPTRQILWLLYDFHTLTWQFCNLCNKSHILQKVPVPYRTQPLVDGPTKHYTTRYNINTQSSRMYEGLSLHSTAISSLQGDQ